MHTASPPETKFAIEGTCIKVYDVETKLVVYTFDNFKKAGHGLRVPASMVSRRCESRKRLYSPYHNKEFACRLVKKDE